MSCVPRGPDRAGQEGEVSAESENRFSSPGGSHPVSVLVPQALWGCHPDGRGMAPGRCAKDVERGHFPPPFMLGSKEGDHCSHLSPPPGAPLRQLRTHTLRSCLPAVGSLLRPVTHRGRGAGGRGRCTPGTGTLSTHLRRFL